MSYSEIFTLARHGRDRWTMRLGSTTTGRKDRRGSKYLRVTCGHGVSKFLSCTVALFVAASLLPADMSRAQDHTIFTDADAGVRIICRNDWSEEQCLVPAGGEHEVISGWEDHPRYVTVKDQNNLDVGYWHFDLSDIDASSQINEARFQLDLQTNSWGDTTVAVFAIADPDADWDLSALPENQINGPTAPQSDWDSFAWTGDPLDPLQRFNSPTPFLDEGDLPSDEVRFVDVAVIDNQDPFTDGTPDDPGNPYGGFACCDAGPGGDGSASHADNGDNIWPVKNAVDVDVTELIQWKLGQNSAYSDFVPRDRELTLLVRTDFSLTGGDNGFANFVAKESEFLGGELDLQPGRIVLSGNININPVGPPLRAGDSDQDLDFDQRDLVQVQIAAKYLTGQPATWGEGDWDGAPGGNQGNPPPGNGVFDQLDIIAALAPDHYLTGPYAAIGAGGRRGDGQTSIVYDAGTGELAVDAPAGTELTSINIDSAAGIFTGQPAQNLGGSFDNDADNNIFKATFGSSFGSLSFGNVAQPGLSQDFVLNDLTIIGSLNGGGSLGDVDLIYVPEPSSLMILAAGLLGTAAAAWPRLGHRRFRRDDHARR